MSQATICTCGALAYFADGASDRSIQAHPCVECGASAWRRLDVAEGHPCPNCGARPGDRCLSRREGHVYLAGGAVHTQRAELDRGPWDVAINEAYAAGLHDGRCGADPADVARWAGAATFRGAYEQGIGHGSAQRRAEHS